MFKDQDLKLNRRSVLGGFGIGATSLALGAQAISAQGTPSASPAATPASGTRTIEHGMGTTEIPANPLRVVALDGPVLDAAFALGVIPVGAVTVVGDQPFPAYLGPDTAQIANVGTISEPNLEAIVALEPDLILSLMVRHEDIYDQLSAIAPTVLSTYFATDWQEGFLYFADVLNKTANAQAVVDRFNTGIANVQSGLGSAASETSVSVIRVYPDLIREYQEISFSGTVLSAIGFQRPESQKKNEDTWAELSLERLGDANADYLFVTVSSSATEEHLQALLDNPLWQTLPVVQAGKVYLVPDEYWMVALGYLAADLIIADIDTYLVKGEPAPEF